MLETAQDGKERHLVDHPELCVTLEIVACVQRQLLGQIVYLIGQSFLFDDVILIHAHLAHLVRWIIKFFIFEFMLKIKQVSNSPLRNFNIRKYIK
jgi:hypothetical protein